jgi:hypothetical protein
MGFFKTAAAAAAQHEHRTQTRNAQAHELKAGKTLRRTKHHLKKAAKADKRANRSQATYQQLSRRPMTELERYYAARENGS